ncbi:serine hydrolase domain-containing protein [soil metagenome]
MAADTGTATSVAAPGEAPLAQVDQWGASNAAAAVLDGSGVRAAHGDVNRVFALASITKLTTALAVLIAIEEGTLDLDEPAGPPGATVEHLLCHASGLDFDSETILAAPATRRIYSNTGYERLAVHLELRSGIAFTEYLHDAVLAPLGLVSTELRGSAARDLYSTVDDLCRFVGELRAPTLVDPSTWQRATQVRYPELAGVLPGWGRQDPCPWGLGPEIHGTKAPHWTGATAPAATYGHFGGSGTFVWVDPGDGPACVVLTDRPFGDWAVDVWPGFSDDVRASYR